MSPIIPITIFASTRVNNFAKRFRQDFAQLFLCLSLNKRSEKFVSQSVLLHVMESEMEFVQIDVARINVKALFSSVRCTSDPWFQSDINRNTRASWVQFDIQTSVVS